jgi:hypothetical protein
MAATDSLIIKDGNGNIKSISANSGTYGYIPEHVISGTVNVSASAANPVYVTGTVQISQPVNVDLVIGDTITASIANTGFAQAVGAITQSYNSGGGYGKFNVQLTGSSVLPQGAYNSLLVTTTASTVTVGNTGFSGMIEAITQSYNSAAGYGKINVQLTGSSVLPQGAYNSLLVTTTASTVTIGNTGFSGMVEAITQSYDSSNGSGKIKVKTLQDSVVTASINSSIASPVYVTGAVIAAVLDGLRVTSSITNPLQITGNVDIGAGKIAYAGGNAIVVKVTSSADIFNVQLVNNSTVELSGSSVKNLRGFTTDRYLQVHQAPAATGSVKKRVFLYPLESVDEQNQYFNWLSSRSGSVLVASSSATRKGLSIFNPTSVNIYVSLGDTNYENTFGFNIFNTSSAPNFYSFILYPSGTYFSEPVNVGLLHGLYAISGNFDYNPVIITETY